MIGATSAGKGFVAAFGCAFRAEYMNGFRLMSLAGARKKLEAALAAATRTAPTARPEKMPRSIRMSSSWHSRPTSAIEAGQLQPSAVQTCDAARAVAVALM